MAEYSEYIIVSSCSSRYTTGNFLKKSLQPWRSMSCLMRVGSYIVLFFFYLLCDGRRCTKIGMVHSDTANQDQDTEFHAKSLERKHLLSMIMKLQLMKMIMLKLMILVLLGAMLLLSMTACSDPTGIFGSSSSATTTSSGGKSHSGGGGSSSSSHSGGSNSSGGQHSGSGDGGGSHNSNGSK